MDREWVSVEHCKLVNFYYLPESDDYDRGKMLIGAEILFARVVEEDSRKQFQLLSAKSRLVLENFSDIAITNFKSNVQRGLAAGLAGSISDSYAHLREPRDLVNLFSLNQLYRTQQPYSNGGATQYQICNIPVEAEGSVDNCVTTTQDILRSQYKVRAEDMAYLLSALSNIAATQKMLDF